MHAFAWDTFLRTTDVAERLKLYGAGQDLLSDAFSGNLRGMGTGYAELDGYVVAMVNWRELLRATVTGVDSGHRPSSWGSTVPPEGAVGPLVVMNCSNTLTPIRSKLREGSGYVQRIIVLGPMVVAVFRH